MPKEIQVRSVDDLDLLHSLYWYSKRFQ
jgi:hypothetical protein